MALNRRQQLAYQDTFRSYRETPALSGSLTKPGAYGPVITDAPCLVLSKRYDLDATPVGRIDLGHFEVLNRIACETGLDVKAGDKIVVRGNAYTVNAQTADRPRRGARNTNYQAVDLKPERNPPAGVV